MVLRFHRVIATFCICASIMNGTGQVIKIHSVVDARGSGNQTGYTLNGNWMTQGSRLKLLNTANFGSTGTYTKSVQINDGFGASGSLTQVTAFPYDDIFFFGSFDKLDPNTAVFTSGEIDSLYNWSVRGGKMIICSGQMTPPQSPPYDSRILNLKWGIFFNNQVPAYYLPTAAGNSTHIFNGPFGAVSGAYQGGSLQGYLSPINTDSRILAQNTDGHPTLIMDCHTLDLIAADVDGYTALSNVTSNSNILNDQDKFWVNTIVFMDQLQPLPKLNFTNGYLGLNASYAGYQWYLNSQPITGAVSASFVPQQNGKYFAEVTFNGGCRRKSDSLTITDVSLDEQFAETTGRLVPQPLETSSTMRFDHEVKDAAVVISDQAGRTIRSMKFSGRMLVIERADLPQGVYLLSITESGNRTARSRLVVD